MLNHVMPFRHNTWKVCRIEELCYFAAIFLKRNNVLLVESTMVRTPNKELDVALELFNSELKKLKSPIRWEVISLLEANL